MKYSRLPNPRAVISGPSPSALSPRRPELSSRLKRFTQELDGEPGPERLEQGVVSIGQWLNSRCGPVRTRSSSSQLASPSNAPNITGSTARSGKLGCGYTRSPPSLGLPDQPVLP
jgi:hypothetical protein